MFSLAKITVNKKIKKNKILVVIVKGLKITLLTLNTNVEILLKGLD